MIKKMKIFIMFRENLIYGVYDVLIFLNDFFFFINKNKDLNYNFLICEIKKKC